MPSTRNTLAGSVTLQGRGLFTSQPASITLAPALPGAGLLFADHASPERATPLGVRSMTTSVAHPAFSKLPPRNTSIDLVLPDDTTRPLFTIEHVCSALVGCGVHDCLVTAQGPEIPILDGSAIDFVRAIQSAGLVRTNVPLDPVVITSPITVEDGRGGSVVIEPSESASYTYHLDYGPDSPIELSTAIWDASPESYATDIAPARTFCLEAEAKQMHALGLFEHLTERDMLVVGPNGPIDNAYRFDHEPAKHKLLDLIGDLALVGRPLLANITATKSGHALHHRAAQAVLDSSPNH